MARPFKTIAFTQNLDCSLIEYATVKLDFARGMCKTAHTHCTVDKSKRRRPNFRNSRSRDARHDVVLVVVAAIHAAGRFTHSRRHPPRHIAGQTCGTDGRPSGNFHYCRRSYRHRLRWMFSGFAESQEMTRVRSAASLLACPPKPKRRLGSDSRSVSRLVPRACQSRTVGGSLRALEQSTSSRCPPRHLTDFTRATAGRCYRRRVAAVPSRRADSVGLIFVNSRLTFRNEKRPTRGFTIGSGVAGLRWRCRKVGGHRPENGKYRCRSGFANSGGGLWITGERIARG